jgi:hypothetical protein
MYYLVLQIYMVLLDKKIKENIAPFLIIPLKTNITCLEYELGAELPCGCLHLGILQVPFSAQVRELYKEWTSTPSCTSMGRMPSQVLTIGQPIRPTPYTAFFLSQKKRLNLFFSLGNVWFKGFWKYTNRKKTIIVYHEMWNSTQIKHTN